MKIISSDREQALASQAIALARRREILSEAICGALELFLEKSHEGAA